MLDDYIEHQLVKVALILQQKEFTQIKFLSLSLKQEHPGEGHGHKRAFSQCGGEMLGKILSITEGSGNKHTCAPPWQLQAVKLLNWTRLSGKNSGYTSNPCLFRRESQGDCSFTVHVLLSRFFYSSFWYLKSAKVVCMRLYFLKPKSKVFSVRLIRGKKECAVPLRGSHYKTPSHAYVFSASIIFR